MWRQKLLPNVRLCSNLCMNKEVSKISRHLDCLQLWNEIKEQQTNLYMSPRVEKAIVTYHGVLGESTLEMTKGISTPLDCAKHLSEILVKESVIAMVNNTPWDMNRPLSCDCSLDFAQFKDPHYDPTIANNAFWQSCTLLLAATLETAFHEKHNVRVINLPLLNPKSGGFVCDISFSPGHQSLENWKPSPQELYALNTYIQRMAADDLSFEPLDVSIHSELLQKLFADNPLRSQQINHVFNKHQDIHFPESVISEDLQITLFIVFKVWLFHLHSSRILRHFIVLWNGLNYQIQKSTFTQITWNLHHESSTQIFRSI
ncbi:putative mitochondrial 39S ribosomal protein L39 [Schistosoma mansoni]|uniref:putative mitochondrial 39S ribosomal protein L39 n=1 Tax=Schistosoma mansoni TaxID=6183 RepID=UPI00022DC9DA|nr:putative mitochondrial 39S ribosomal protein L39 [Schistosoma mansoni]|eukprot:XP_018655663.1 putative mitochondrial 39S ribosomal protein L39 [Schistosoma mansoni]